MREAKGLPCGPLGVDEKRRGDGEDSSRFETLGRLAHRPAISRNGWPAPPRQPTAALCPSAEGFGGSRLRRHPREARPLRGAPSATSSMARPRTSLGSAARWSLSAAVGAGRFYISSRKLIEARPPGRPLVNPATAARKAAPQSGLTTPASSPWARRQRLRPPPRTAPSTPASGKSRRLAAGAPKRPRASRSGVGKLAAPAH